MLWLHSLAHSRWLEAEADRTFEFGRNAAVPTGFGWLSNEGQPRAGVDTQLWITSRMVHVYSLAHLLGRPGSGLLADHGIDALNGPFWDEVHGGWFGSVNDAGPADRTKPGYPHFFVALGAASAVAAGRPGARQLLDRAIEVIERHFWSEDEGMCLESWNEDFTETEDYRGGNVNMHAVEAFLVVADVTGDDVWLERALSIATTIIHRVARSNQYRVVEHFDPQWNPLLEYNSGNRAHRFRAYGGTPGHWMEWSRLLISLRDSLIARGRTAPEWLLEDARGLFQAATRDAWEPDGRPGFVYTVGWDGAPIVTARIRWVVVEGMGGAVALYRATGDEEYARWYERFWDYARTYLMDLENGSWHQELDADHHVNSAVWDGKPDIYHLMHCLLVPRLPLAPAMAPALAAGLLDSVVGAEPRR
ncbi:AGE family epimerase/isomerase [Ruania albidiflava]|uniref:AGE family epimerase/isomerase n=1 Tax=Ruania albidiflava TaxID=366586 RepID=UPI0003B789ED|nr:AGE family epimerase/isomerase [Ruania albidiflava]